MSPLMTMMMMLLDFVKIYRNQVLLGFGHKMSGLKHIFLTRFTNQHTEMFVCLFSSCFFVTWTNFCSHKNSVFFLCFFGVCVCVTVWNPFVRVYSNHFGFRMAIKCFFFVFSSLFTVSKLFRFSLSVCNFVFFISVFKLSPISI